MFLYKIRLRLCEHKPFCCAEAFRHLRTCLYELVSVRVEWVHDVTECMVIQTVTGDRDSFLREVEAIAELVQGRVVGTDFVATAEVSDLLRWMEHGDVVQSDFEQYCSTGGTDYVFPRGEGWTEVKKGMFRDQIRSRRDILSDDSEFGWIGFV